MINKLYNQLEETRRTPVTERMERDWNVVFAKLVLAFLYSKINELTPEGN